jgi:hypothetical protein
MPYKLPFKLIDKVRFQPWVGKNCNSRVPRLLVLGMSHYSWGDKNLPDYFVTNEVIRHQVRPDAKEQFFTNIIATCIGHLPSGEERVAFWHSVAFYNYIQEFVGDSPRRSHAYELWQRSEPAFEKILLRLRPQLVLVIGVLNWGSIANLNGWSGNRLRHVPEPKYADTWWYPVGDGKAALAFHVKHMSAGYNFRKFAALFHEAEQVAIKGWHRKSITAPGN